MDKGVVIVIDKAAVFQSPTEASVVTRYHYEYASTSTTVPDSRGLACYTFSSTPSFEYGGRWTIDDVFDVMEPKSPKPGDAGL